MAQAVTTVGSVPRGVGQEATASRGFTTEQWWIIITVIFGVFVSILDTTIVNTAIPKIQAIFGSSLHDAQYINTAYTLAQAVVVGASSFFASRFGVKQTFLTSLGLFTLGSALCGLAPSLTILIFFRILQGAGGAALFPLGIALIFSSVSQRQRGLVNGVFGIPVLFAPAIGPTLGGFIVQYVDWRWIFYVNVPIGILGVLIGVRYLPGRPGNPAVRFDARSFVPLAGGLGLLLYGLTNLASDGWSSISSVSGPTIAGSLLLIVFVVVSLTSKAPLLDLRVFANRTFLIGNIIIALATVGLFGAQFLLPQYLQNLRGLDPLHSGLQLLPLGLAAMVATVFAGALFNRVGPGVLMIFGAALLTIDTYLLANWIGAPNSAYAALPILLILRGLSLPPLAQTSNTVALRDIQGQALNSASTLIVVTRLVVASFALAIFTNILITQEVAHAASLASQATRANPVTLGMISSLTRRFEAQGLSAAQATSAALGQMYRQVSLNATVLAFRDVFLVSAAITIPAILLSFVFLRSRPAAPSGAERPAVGE